MTSGQTYPPSPRPGIAVGDASARSGYCDPKAQEIYADLLHRIEAAYVEADWPRFRAAVAVPHWLATPGRIRCIRNSDQMQNVFEAFRDFQRTSRVSNMARVTLYGLFRSDDLIRGAHDTHMVDDSGMRVLDPYRVASSLRRGADGRWRVAASHSVVSERGWPALAYAARTRRRSTE